MDRQFDELSKSLAEDVSRRGALRKIGFGLAAVLAAAIGLVDAQEAEAGRTPCTTTADCKNNKVCCSGKCTNIKTDPGNCGGCGHVCSHKEPVCVKGVCFYSQ